MTSFYSYRIIHDAMVEVLRSRQETQRQTEGELPESKIFDLLSSVGNAEHKALELIVMKKGIIYSEGDLWREVMSYQPKDRGWRMNSSLPFEHCRKSLSPIGLVTKEALSYDGTAWGYQITEFGIHTGIPFAGLLLKWSYEHPNSSLYKMFASTASPAVKDEQTLEKKRAQETRYKIFWEVVTNPRNRIRLQDIANDTNEEEGIISRHLNRLSNNGVISYEAHTSGKPFSYFRRKEIVPDQQPKQYGDSKTLSAQVYDFLTREYLSIEETVNLLIEKYPRYESLDRSAFGKSVTHILSDLVKQGYLERKKFSHDFHSELNLSEEQREAILSLVTLIDKFKNGDSKTIEEGRRFAQKVSSDPNLFSELILKAKEASPHANRTNWEETFSMLLTILQGYPNSTTNQIMQILKKDYGKRLTSDGLRCNLSRLVNENLIISKKTKSGNVYMVVEDSKLPQTLRISNHTNIF